MGYAERSRVSNPGEFAIDGRTVAFVPRGGEFAGRAVQVSFAEPPVRKAASKAPPVPERVAKIVIADKAATEVSLDPPVLSGLVTGSREKRRRVALEAIPERMQQAVLAIEDRRFYYHPGVDPIRMLGALVTNLRGNRAYLVGASTITQQLARNFFLTEEMAEEQQTRQRSIRRKLLEQFMAVILETKATKDEILELYLNDVYLGNRGSFALHGVAEASRMFFGKDVTNLTLAEAALLAGVIQSPYNHSPFTSVERARERRNVVLRAMADADYITADAATRAADEPITVVARALDNEAPYFVDYMSQALDDAFPGVTARPTPLEIYTTLDLNLQRAAQDAVREGLARVDETLARRRKGETRRAQAALVALDPRSGEILAMVGGRSYNQSQFNRAVLARRQPGSTFKPFVYLAAFEQAADGWPRRHHARHDGVGRADDVDLRRAGVGAAQLRGQLRRQHHAAAGAGPVAQHRHHQDRRADRLRSRRLAVGPDQGRSAAAEGLSRPSRSASSSCRRSRWRPPTPCSPTAA